MRSQNSHCPLWATVAFKKQTYFSCSSENPKPRRSPPPPPLPQNLLIFFISSDHALSILEGDPHIARPIYVIPLQSALPDVRDTIPPKDAIPGN